MADPYDRVVGAATGFVRGVASSASSVDPAFAAAAMPTPMSLASAGSGGPPSVAANSPAASTAFAAAGADHGQGRRVGAACYPQANPPVQRHSSLPHTHAMHGQHPADQSHVQTHAQYPPSHAHAHAHSHSFSGTSGAYITAAGSSSTATGGGALPQHHHQQPQPGGALPVYQNGAADTGTSPSGGGGDMSSAIAHSHSHDGHDPIHPDQPSPLNPDNPGSDHPSPAQYGMAAHMARLPATSSSATSSSATNHTGATLAHAAVSSNGGGSGSGSGGGGGGAQTDVPLQHDSLMNFAGLGANQLGWSGGQDFFDLLGPLLDVQFDPR
ncbi:hypothetical protein KEM52_005565 [Ascosphaera acerosa]|nr:hypothetical protein KEM52_005565 [Ascosphaera acerosa]